MGEGDRRYGRREEVRGGGLAEWQDLQARGDRRLRAAQLSGIESAGERGREREGGREGGSEREGEFSSPALDARFGSPVVDQRWRRDFAPPPAISSCTAELLTPVRVCLHLRVRLYARFGVLTNQTCAEDIEGT